MFVQVKTFFFHPKGQNDQFFQYVHRFDELISITKVITDFKKEIVYVM